MAASRSRPPGATVRPLALGGPRARSPTLAGGRAGWRSRVVEPRAGDRAAPVMVVFAPVLSPQFLLWILPVSACAYGLGAENVGPAGGRPPHAGRAAELRRRGRVRRRVRLAARRPEPDAAGLHLDGLGSDRPPTRGRPRLPAHSLHRILLARRPPTAPRPTPAPDPLDAPKIERQSRYPRRPRPGMGKSRHLLSRHYPTRYPTSRCASGGSRTARPRCSATVAVESPGYQRDSHVAVLGRSRFRRCSGEFSQRSIAPRTVVPGP